MTGLVHVEPVMGTTVTLDVRDTALTRAELVRAVARGVEVLHDADRTFSTYRPASAISRLRRGALRVEQCPAEVVGVLARCGAAKERSGGWFDPWAMPGGVDPTGLVKGWAAQRALRAMARHGVEHALVNAGGDVAVLGDPDGTPTGRGWRVGITDPLDPGRLLAAVRVRDGGVATSGGYERGSLAVDPHDGARVHRLAGVTVVAGDLALADALSTAAAAHGPGALAWLTAAPGVEALLVLPDGSLRSTPGWQGTIVAGPGRAQEAV